LRAVLERGSYHARIEPICPDVHVLGESEREWDGECNAPQHVEGATMPLYDFECRACHHQFEALVRGSETPSCPSCHGQDLERLLSSFGMTTLEHTKQLVSAERKKRAPKQRAEQQEEFQRTLREHLHD
jgi:putative FmdB family regulatory protein